MKSRESISITVNKPYDYQPIPAKEKERIVKLITSKLLNLANRFDGPSSIKVTIFGKGNS